MNIKSLLLGSAAALFAVTGARAADASDDKHEAGRAMYVIRSGKVMVDVPPQDDAATPPPTVDGRMSAGAVCRMAYTSSRSQLPSPDEDSAAGAVQPAAPSASEGSVRHAMQAVLFVRTLPHSAPSALPLCSTAS